VQDRRVSAHYFGHASHLRTMRPAQFNHRPGIGLDPVGVDFQAGVRMNMPIS